MGEMAVIFSYGDAVKLGHSLSIKNMNTWLNMGMILMMM